MEAKLLGTKSDDYGPIHMRRKLKEGFKKYNTFCQQEGKSDFSKLLHEFHLDSGKKTKMKKNLRVIRTTTTRLIFSDITSLNIDSVWYPDTSTFSDVKKQFILFYELLV